jgi:hypothetical protein
MSWKIKGESVTYNLNDISQTELLINLNAANAESYNGSGTTWTDLSGNNRNGTIVGSPSWDGQSFDITSDSTYISLDSYSHGIEDFTYSILVKFDAFDTYDTLFENGAFADCGPLFRVQSRTSIAVYTESGLSGTFTWNPSINNWYNVVYRRSGSTNSLFVNGVLTGPEFTNQTNISLANANMWLMRSQHSGNQFTNGKIGQFALYTRALNKSEIESNYNYLSSIFTFN